jgi:peptidoglycan/LPS O-acetylase OafA/YrhL
MGKVLKIAPAEGHYAAIDGLRGYLAFFVFLYHSSIWFFYVRGVGWGAPPSMLYGHFGPTSVAFFFMITSFLFFSKLLQARGRQMDWLKLYVGRIMRICPLYIFAVLVIFLLIGVLTHFTLRTPLSDLLWGMLKWLAFIQTNLNGMFATSRIVAGVVWSLPFEWMFYCSLPFLGLLLKIRSSLSTLLPALVCGLFFLYVIQEFYPIGGMQRAMPFFSGMLAAFLARNKKAREMASSSVVSIIMVVLLAVSLGFFSSILEPAPLLMMTFVFCAIACGNDLFGILSHPLSRTFGQISYSIYLLHGMVLFVTFRWILGFERVGHLTPLQYWGLIILCGMGVVVVSSLTYVLVEKPGMEAAPRTTAKIKKLLGRNKVLPAPDPIVSPEKILH